MAEFLYSEIFCRYLCPTEAIVHDRGSEFCNDVVKKLFKDYNVNIRVTSAGRPQGNGQAEIFVKTLKEKMKALMFDQKCNSY